MIPFLEPMLGAALALNLAYLNLPIFSFLTQISREVADRLESIEPTTLSHVEQTGWFKNAQALARVKNLGEIGLNNAVSAKTWIPFNGWVCAVLFNVLFNLRVGKVIACLATAFAVTMIVFGVKINIEPNPVNDAYWASWIGYPFGFTLLSFLWPIFCVGAGAYIRYETVKDVNNNIRGLGVKALDDAAAELSRAEKAVAAAGQ